MKWLMQRIFPILLVVAISNAQVPSFGNCPDIKVVDTFNPKEYLGIWYEYEKFPFIFELLGKCNYAKYGDFGNGTISVINAQINRVTGKPSNITGTADVIEPGKLLVKLGTAKTTAESNYWILGIDYKSFSVVYSCSQGAKYFKAQSLWILTRERKPSEETIQRAYEVLNANDLSKSLLLKTNQNECPEPESDEKTD